MRKNLTLPMLLFLLLLCGCTENGENSKTEILLDTVVSVTADCDDETLDGVFELCRNLERTLSSTESKSEVYKLNNSNGFVTVSDSTLKIIERSLFYSELSGGKFDITVYPVSSIWDFNEEVVPSKNEIAEALKNVDYHSIEIRKNEVSTGGKKIDLGSIAKGYIADEMVKYFSEKEINNAVVNLGGNVAVKGTHTVGIQAPFKDGLAASIEITDKSAVTSGIYQRYIKKDGKIYHHVLDPDTGYGVENELASVTIIGKSSLDCDALSTVCLLLGTEKGKRIINNTADTEAVFIDRNGKITLTDGLYREDSLIKYK